MTAIKTVTSEKMLEESRTRGERSQRWSLVCRALDLQPAPPQLKPPISCPATGFLTIVLVLQMRKLKAICSRSLAKKCLSQDSNPDFTLYCMMALITRTLPPF